MATDERFPDGVLPAMSRNEDRSPSEPHNHPPPPKTTSLVKPHKQIKYCDDCHLSPPQIVRTITLHHLQYVPMYACMYVACASL